MGDTRWSTAAAGLLALLSRFAIAITRSDIRYAFSYPALLIVVAGVAAVFSSAILTPKPRIITVCLAILWATPLVLPAATSEGATWSFIIALIAVAISLADPSPLKLLLRSTTRLLGTWAIASAIAEIPI